MKLKLALFLALASTLLFIYMAKEKIVNDHKKVVISCSLNTSANIADDVNNTKVDGVREMIFFNDNTLQVNTALKIHTGNKVDWYYKDIVYKINTYDDDWGLMALSLIDVHSHTEQNVPTEVADNFILYHTTKKDEVKYITVRRISKDHIIFGDLYSPTGICLIDK